MQVQVVLILDSEKDSALKYQESLEKEKFVYSVTANTVEDAYEKVIDLEPELLLLNDNFEENVSDLIKQLRGISSSYRPIIMVISKSENITDKLDILKAGADDFISSSVNDEELTIRVFAHLRRHIEELSHPVTKLPTSHLAYKVIKRAIKLNKKWALLYIDIDNFKTYSEIYGYLASDNLLKTFSAILKSAIDKNDFLGHLQNDNFVILTSQIKADKIAIYLNYAFDSISSKFYSEKDVNRGYLIATGDEKAGRRIPLVSISIGIVSNEYRSFHNYQEVINSVINVHKLAKVQPGSSWVSDRPKITSEFCLNNPDECRKKVLIVESDAAMAYLLTTTLEMQGYKTEATSNLNETLSTMEKNKPDLLLLDVGNKDSELGLEICRKIKANPDFLKTKVILSTIIHEKERVLNAGADLYLPKPYELMTLYGWISKFFNI